MKGLLSGQPGAVDTLNAPNIAREPGTPGKKLNHGLWHGWFPFAILGAFAFATWAYLSA